MGAANFGGVSAAISFAHQASLSGRLRGGGGGEPPVKDPIGLIFAVLFSSVAAVCLILTAIFHFFPPDTYIRSELKSAVVTKIDGYYISFLVNSQPYRDIDLGKHCHPRVKVGHRWIATVDVMKTRKGVIHGQVNWASLRREFCS